MKKILSFTLVLAMILGSVSFCFAERNPFPTVAGQSFTDVTKDMDCFKAVEVLKAIGAVDGTSAGRFQPEATLTRAQIVAFVVKALGYPVTEGNSYVTKFADVPATEWYAGYVYWASNLGIVEGRTATKFDPNAKVTADEATAFILRILGYTDDVIGGYPAGYALVANGFDFYDVISAGSATVTRGETAQLVYAIASAPFGYIANGEVASEKKGTWHQSTPTTTILTIADCFTEAVNNVVKDDAIYANAGKVVEYVDEIEDYSKLDMTNTLGTSGVVYYKNTKAKNTAGDKVDCLELIAYVPTTTFVTGFAGTTIDTYTLGGYKFKTGVLTADGKAVTEKYVATITNDYEVVTPGSRVEFKTTDTNTYAVTLENGVITAVNTKIVETPTFVYLADADAVKAFYTAPKAGTTGVVKPGKLTVNSVDYTLPCVLDANKLKTTAVDYSLIDLDGIEKFEDVTAGTFLAVYTAKNDDNDNVVSKVAVITDKVTGTVARVELATKTTETNKYVIDGTKYEANGATIKAGDKGTFYLYDGKIVKFVADKDAVATEVTAYVVKNTEKTTKAAFELQGDYYIETVADVKASVQLLGADGTVATYEYATATDAAKVKDGSFVTYTLKDGKIATVKSETLTTGASITVNTKGVATNNAVFNADTVVVVYADDTTTAAIANPVNNPANYVVTKGTALAGETLKKAAYFVDPKTGFVKFALVELNAPAALTDTYVVTAEASLAAGTTEYTALNLMDGKTYVFTTKTDLVSFGEAFTNVVVDAKGMMTCTTGSSLELNDVLDSTDKGYATKVVEGMLFKATEVTTEKTTYAYVATIADDAVVYSYDATTKAWAVKTVADLAFTNTDSSEKNVYADDTFTYFVISTANPFPAEE